MRDRHEYPANEGSRGDTAARDAENARGLQAYTNRETGLALPVPEDSTNYAELFARLQKLIDNATQTIRDLRRENAELSGRVSQLDAYIQMRAEVTDNEEELQKSAARLEELLTLQGAAGEAVVPPAPPTPLRAFEPLPPAPLASPAASVMPPGAPPAPSITLPAEPPRESPTTKLNGYAPLRESAAYMPLPARPVEPAPVAPANRVPAEPVRGEADTYVPPVPRETATREGASLSPWVRDETVTMPPPPAPVLPRAPEPAVEAQPAPEPPVVAPPSPAPTPAAVAAPAPVAPPAVETAPTPIRRTATTPMSGSEKVAGTYTLVVYPFTRFSDLGQFQSVLQELVGIHDVQVRRFAQGTLEMRLGYDGVTPLPQALHNLSVKIADVEEEEPYRLRVRLDLNNAT